MHICEVKILTEEARKVYYGGDAYLQAAAMRQDVALRTSRSDAIIPFEREAD